MVFWPPTGGNRMGGFTVLIVAGLCRHLAVLGWV